MRTLLLFLPLLLLSGCDDPRYTIILAIDAKDYRSGMTWSDVRDAGFRESDPYPDERPKKPFVMLITDVDGKPIPLFRFEHESNEKGRLDENPIHLSTPIIIERKQTELVVLVTGHGREPLRIHVDSHKLPKIVDDPSFYLLVVDLNSKALVPTVMSVTPAADTPVAPATTAAHL
jgi:hypothetical protein